MSISRTVLAFGITALVALPAVPAVAGHDVAGNDAVRPARAASPSVASSADAVAADDAAAARVAVTDQRTVRLITGDQVAVRTHRDGKVDASILPGSPHYGDRAIATRIGTTVNLTPQLPIPIATKLDRSLFDVTALAGGGPARVPVRITYAAGKVPYAIEGLTLALSTARHTAGGTSIVTGSYGPDFGGIRPVDLAGVASIRLDAPDDAAGSSRPSASTHQLTVTLSTGAGRPAPYATALIENVDNTRRYLETPNLDRGKLVVDVPSGDYSVILYTFSKLVIAPEFSVHGDTTVALNLADATLRPKIRVPGYRLQDGATSVSRFPEKGFSFALSFLGGERLYPALQPASGDVEHGLLRSGVAGVFMPTGDDRTDAHASMAVTADSSRGIPQNLDIVHPRADFAEVEQRFHANGPAGLRDTGLTPYAPWLDFFGGYSYPVQVPGTRTVLFQAAPRNWYQQSFFPFEQPGDFGIGELDKVSRYTKAGHAPDVDFARGPVGPGIETGYDNAPPGRYCGMCRTGDSLHGFLTLFNGAGSAMIGFLGLKDGGWELLHDGDVLDAGHGQISPSVTLPKTIQRYALVATSQPHSKLWTQSTWVRDAWSFDSGTGKSTIPLLMPSYLPPIRLDGSMRSRHAEFPLRFGNLGRADRRVTQAAAFWSVDGGQVWHRAQVKRLHRQAFDVSYTIPEGSGAPRYVSLRVSGTDTAGNHVLETALRTYLLRS